MKLVMMESRDGFVARTEDDPMVWTGKIDKQVFRLLTCVGGTLACGSTTWGLLPPTLAGRRLIRLSTKPDHTGLVPDLKWYKQTHPNGWLIGGATVAAAAFGQDLLDQMFICMSDDTPFRLYGAGPRLPLLLQQRNRLTTGSRWEHSCTIGIVDVSVQVWNRRR